MKSKREIRIRCEIAEKKRDRLEDLLADKQRDMHLHERIMRDPSYVHKLEWEAYLYGEAQYEVARILQEVHKAAKEYRQALEEYYRSEGREVPQAFNWLK